MNKIKMAEKMERDFKGVWIPKEIYLAEDLNALDKLLLVEINSLDKGDEKGCFASSEYLGNFLGKGEDNINKMIAKLKKLGYIKRIYFDGRIRGLRIVKNYNSKNYKPTKKNCKKLQTSNNSISNNSLEVSKDTLQAEPAKVFYSNFAKDIITLWNQQPGVPKIKTNKPSKTIKKIERSLRELKKGTFCDPKVTRKKFDVDWFKQNRIPFNRTRYTEKQITQGVLNAALSFVEGMYPANKELIKSKSLASYLYDDFNHNSWFLRYMLHPPQPLEGFKMNNPCPKLTNLIAKYITKYGNNGFDKTKRTDRNKLIINGKKIVEFCADIPETSLAEFNQYGIPYDNPMKICKRFIEWMEHSEGSWATINVQAFNPDGGVWPKFIDDLFDEIHQIPLTEDQYERSQR